MFLCVSAFVWSSWFFGIATASSLGASPLLLLRIHLYFNISLSPYHALSLSPSFPLSPSSPTVWRSRRSGIMMHACGVVLGGSSLPSESNRERKRGGGKIDYQRGRVWQKRTIRIIFPWLLWWYPTTSLQLMPPVSSSVEDKAVLQSGHFLVFVFVITGR